MQLPQFFRYITKERSNPLGTPFETNPNAEQINNPLVGRQGVVYMCEYMKTWWGNCDNPSGFVANDYVALAYPSKTQYAEEMVSWHPHGRSDVRKLTI